MSEILDDQPKLKRLPPVFNNGNAASIESRLQKQMLDLVKAALMPKWMYDATLPIESLRRPNVWSAETHKEGTPLHPILSMTGSAHYELGRWLAGLLQPVLERFSFHRISDSFTFAKTM